MWGMTLLVDSNRGVYVPQHFAEHRASDGWTVSPEHLAILRADPGECSFYWDVWATVLDGATYTDHLGNTWWLCQDGDLWAICPELMTHAERADWLAPPPPNDPAT